MGLHSELIKYKMNPVGLKADRVFFCIDATAVDKISKKEGCIMKKGKWGISIAGALAGAVNGLFGAGGGMILVPLLTGFSDLEEDQVFPSSVSIILPICFVSLGVTAWGNPLPMRDALPYLLGSIPGGILAGIADKKIPVKWLHRVLGVLIIWGGIRYLC